MREEDHSNMPISKMQQTIAVLWPSFLTAGLATILFFTAFDPQEILPGGREVDRLAAYTVGFFMFWGLTAGTSLLTCYFQRPCDRK
jgi:hypothetical protein